MSPPRLSIRVDVDVEHARRALDTQAPGSSAQIGRAALGEVVRLLRERLRRDVAAAYPEARVVVTMWRKEPKARATKVRIGHRIVDGHTERRCALIAEHVDALRTAAVASLWSASTAPIGDQVDVAATALPLPAQMPLADDDALVVSPDLLAADGDGSLPPAAGPLA